MDVVDVKGCRCE